MNDRHVSATNTSLANARSASATSAGEMKRSFQRRHSSTGSDTSNLGRDSSLCRRTGQPDERVAPVAVADAVIG